MRYDVLPQVLDNGLLLSVSPNLSGFIPKYYIGDVKAYKCGQVVECTVGEMCATAHGECLVASFTGERNSLVCVLTEVGFRCSPVHFRGQCRGWAHIESGA